MPQRPRPVSRPKGARAILGGGGGGDDDDYRSLPM